MTADWARQRCGVCLTDAGELDGEATMKLRQEIRVKRLEGAEESREGRVIIDPANDEIAVSEGLVVVPGADAYACRKCRTRIADAGSNYKSGCLKKVTPVEAVGISPVDPKLFIDDDIVYKEYFCPGCGLHLQGDFSKSENEDIRDIHLFLD